MLVELSIDNCRLHLARKSGRCRTHWRVGDLPQDRAGVDLSRALLRAPATLTSYRRRPPLMLLVQSSRLVGSCLTGQRLRCLMPAVLRCDDTIQILLAPRVHKLRSVFHAWLVRLHLLAALAAAHCKVALTANGLTGGEGPRLPRVAGTDSICRSIVLVADSLDQAIDLTLGCRLPFGETVEEAALP